MPNHQRVLAQKDRLQAAMGHALNQGDWTRDEHASVAAWIEDMEDREFSVLFACMASLGLVILLEKAELEVLIEEMLK